MNAANSTSQYVSQTIRKLHNLRDIQSSAHREKKHRKICIIALYHREKRRIQRFAALLEAHTTTQTIGLNVYRKALKKINALKQTKINDEVRLIERLQ